MRATVVSWTRQAAPRGTVPLAARPQPPPSAARNVTVPPTEVESKFGVTTRVRPHGWKRLRQPANDVTAQLASRSVTTVRGLMSAPSQRGCTKLTRRRQGTVSRSAPRARRGTSDPVRPDRKAELERSMPGSGRRHPTAARDRDVGAHIARRSADCLAERCRNAVVNDCRDRAKRRGIERAGRDVRLARIEQAGPHEVRHNELLRKGPADRLVIERAGDGHLERRAPDGDAAPDVEEPQVKPCFAVRATLEHDWTADPAARRRVRDLRLHFGFVVPGAVEGEHVGEAEGRALAVELQQRGAQGARIGLADPDEVHRIRLNAESETGKRPQRDRLSRKLDRHEWRRRGSARRGIEGDAGRLHGRSRRSAGTFGARGCAHQQKDERCRPVTHLHNGLRWWNRLMRDKIAETLSSTSKAMSAGRISGKQCPFLNNACMSEGYATFMGVWLGTALLDAVI